MRCLAIRPRRMWRRGCPTPPTSGQILHSKNTWVHGQRANSSRSEVVEKAEGQGFRQ